MELPASADPADVLSSASGRLFLERAAAVHPGRELTPDDAQSAFDICHSVGGVPLALELAAGMCDDSTIAEVAARVGDGSIATLLDASTVRMSSHEQRALSALTVPASPVPPVLAIAAIDATGAVGADDVLARLVRRAVLRLDPDGRYSMLAAIRSRLRSALSKDDVDAVLGALLGACLEATTDAAPLGRHEPVVATSTMLLEHDALPAADRQRLAAQLAPWWTARLGAVRAREHLTAALHLGDAGPSAAAVHLAIADTYPAGQETLDTEWHLQRAAVLLGEHDTVDPDLVARLQAMITRDSPQEGGSARDHRG
jgi:hypothetical protein